MSKRTKTIQTKPAGLPSTIKAGDRDALEKAMLRKQVAELQAERAQAVVLQRNAEWSALCAEMTKRYALGAKDGITIETGEIVRAAATPPASGAP
jgi:hypothetical protein